MKKMLFVYNPRAGKSAIRGNLSPILEQFAKAEYEITVYPTQKQGDAIEIVAAKASEYDLITCSGGDGTLDEVVLGLRMSGVQLPIGYIPAGSTNDFAASLNIPKDMEAAAIVAVTGNEYLCDLGTLNGDLFVYVAAFGNFTEVTYETDQTLKNMFGHLAYILEGMKKVSEIRTYPLTVISDEIQLEEEFLIGMVTNSISVGGFKNITGKTVKLDDGLFEVTLVRKPKNPIEFNQLLIAVMEETIESPCIYRFKTGRVEFRSSEPVAWTRDGEFGGEHMTAIVENMPQALQIRIP